jgi:predicted esterase
MKPLIRIALLSMGLILSAEARTWTSISGKQIEAEFVSEAFGQVTLKTTQGEQIGIPLAKLSPADREFIQAQKLPAARTRSTTTVADEDEDAPVLAPRHGTPEVVAKMVPGATFIQTAAGPNAVTYHVRVPPGYNPAQPPPLVIAFSSTGKGHSILRSISASTDKAGWIGIGCDKLMNSMDDKLANAMEDEVLEDIYRHIPHDPRRVYLAGHSGGASRAYSITARRKEPFAGILAYGGWLGGPPRQKDPYCKRMAVAMVNGDKDEAANGWAASDKQALQLRKCKVELFTFPGGHPMPNDPEVSDRAIAWLQQEWTARAAK